MLEGTLQGTLFTDAELDFAQSHGYFRVGWSTTASSDGTYEVDLFDLC